MKTISALCFSYVLTSLAAASVGLLLIKKRRNKRNRSCWVKPWISRRTNKGILNLIHKELLLEDPTAYKNYLRMNNDIFLKLLTQIEPYISKQDTVMREAISAHDKLSITLRFLASGETYRNLMYSTRVHESTIAQFIPVVCKSIYEILKDDYMKVPTTNGEWIKIANDFQKLWQVPNAIGALDGKHIAFTAPKDAGSLFFNYKGYHSIVLLALVDARYRFLYVDVGANGRVSDGGVFAHSNLSKALDNNLLNIPQDKALPGRIQPTPFVILADAAFPLKQFIMKPYPFRGQTQAQIIFNYRLSRGRRVVENAFGMLANRFRILLTTIKLHPDKVKHITLACCTLHNFLMEESSEYNSSMQEPIPAVHIDTIEPQRNNRAANKALQTREEFREYFNGCGAVPWQNQMCN